MGVLAVHACFAGEFSAVGRNEVSSKRWRSACARMNWMRRIIVGTSIAPGNMPQAPGVAVPSVLKMPMCPHAAPFIADERSRHRVPQFRVPGHRHATVERAHENAMHADILLRTGIKLAVAVKISAASAWAQPHRPRRGLSQDGLPRLCIQLPTATTSTAPTTPAALTVVSPMEPR